MKAAILIIESVNEYQRVRNTAIINPDGNVLAQYARIDGLSVLAAFTTEGRKIGSFDGQGYSALYQPESAKPYITGFL